MTLASDAPDWTSATDSPAAFIGGVSMPHGSSSNTGSVTVPSNASGVVVVVLHPAALSGLVQTVKVVGHQSGTVYADITTDVDAGATAACGPGVALETSLDVTVTWNGSNSGAPFQTVQLSAVFGTGIQMLATTPQQPLPVLRGRGVNTLTASSQVFSAASATAGDQLLTTYTTSATGTRFVRRARMSVAAPSGVGTSGWFLYLKGATSGSTFHLVDGATVASTAQYQSESEDFEDHPVDMVTAFPTDTSVQLRCSLPATCVGSFHVVATGGF